MNALNGTPLQETFSNILQKLGKMGDYYTLADELSQDQLGGYVRLFRWLLTQPNYANLKQSLVDQQFFVLITQLANLDQQHEDAGLPATSAPSAQLKQLLDDPQLLALQPRLLDQNDLRHLLLQLDQNPDGLETLVRRLAIEEEADDFPSLARQLAGDDNLSRATHFLTEHPGLVARLAPSETALRALLLRLSADEDAPLVEKLAHNGLYHVVEKLTALPDDDSLIGRLADDTTPFLAITQLLAAHQEMDGLLGAILRLLANDPGTHTLPDDEQFARLVIDLAESQAVLDPGRREEFFDLARGFAVEPDSQDLARKILFNARFPQVAARLADNSELTNLVRYMLDDERYQKVAEMLKTNDTARLFIALAEKPDYLETLDQLEGDESFHELVTELRTNPDFFQQVSHLSKDEVLKGLDGALAQRPLNAGTIADQLCSLGERLQEQGNTDEAITTYMLALRLDAGLRKGYLGHAQACQSKGYHTQAVEDYRTLIEKNTQDSHAYLKLGQVYLRMNMLDEAEQSFRKVLELSTDQEERQQADEGLATIARFI